MHHAVVPIREGVLCGIRHQFCDYETQEFTTGGWQRTHVGCDLAAHADGLKHRLRQRPAEMFNIVLDGDPGVRSADDERPMEVAEGSDTRLVASHQIPGLRRQK